MKAGIMCAHSAAAAKEYSVKVAVSSQNEGSCSASRSVASSAGSWPATTAPRDGVPRSAQACRGAARSSSTAPIARSAPRHSNSAISPATAGNDSVLAKPPTNVSAVMPCT
jgi:hypothetical protein